MAHRHRGACATHLTSDEAYDWLERLKVRRRDVERIVGAITVAPRIVERLRADRLDPAQVVALADPFAPDAPLLALARDDRVELREYFVRLRDVRLEIGGADLIELGLAESPRVGEILAEIRRRKLNGEVGGRDAELEAARELVAAVAPRVSVASVATIAERYARVCERSARTSRSSSRRSTSPRTTWARSQRRVSTVVGENRAQDLERKHARYGDTFRWHFIGHLQSNKVKVVNGLCELVHSLGSDSAARRVTVPALLEVNLSAEGSKSGVAPEEIGDYVTRYPLIRGLMTMPPLTADAEGSRPYFRRLRELAAEHGLEELSMGTSQDYRVAAEEGATLVRVGSTIFSAGQG